MMQGTTLTKNNGLPFWHLNKAYISLALVPKRSDGSKTITLKRCGGYEVRLIEMSQADAITDCFLWLELYCHTTQASLDSCRCDGLDDAEAASDYLVSCAKQLYGKS
jgi:hypothetical protein